MKSELKDWQIAQMMFGKNTKHECKIVAMLRKDHTIEKLDDEWSIIYNNKLVDDCGWLIPNNCLNS